jgi:hypothetical protein
MTIRLNPRWLLVSALLFSLQFCRAQVVVPSSLSFDLGTSNSVTSQLWDISGSYTLNLLVRERNGVDVPVQVSFNLVQDSKGKLTGPTNDFEGLVISDSSIFAVTPKISGKVTGSAGVARVHFTVRLHGSGQLGGQNVNSLNASVTFDAETDPTTGQLVASKPTKFSASFSGQPGLKGVDNSEVATPLPPGVDGHWNLTMQLVAVSRVTGIAIATTQNRAMGFDMSGTFKKDIFKIKAKGTTDVPNTVTGAGSSATIILTPTFDTIQLTGKILGQKMLFFFPPDDQTAL